MGEVQSFAICSSNTQKKSKVRPTVIESSDESDSNLNKKKNTTSGGDTDVEVIEDPKETPEEELYKINILV